MLSKFTQLNCTTIFPLNTFWLDYLVVQNDKLFPWTMVNNTTRSLIKSDHYKLEFSIRKLPNLPPQNITLRLHSLV